MQNRSAVRGRPRRWPTGATWRARIGSVHHGARGPADRAAVDRAHGPPWTGYITSKGYVI